MNSAERREARYRRRVAKRQQKKFEQCPYADNYDAVFSYDNLYKAYRCCRRGVSWKASVQRYISQAPLNVYNTYVRLQKGTYKSPGFYEFDIYERGKKRHIRSTVIGERVVQRCLCDNALVPLLGRTFIYDNGASMKNKGYDFAVNRITQHLHQHYRKYGNDGYILLFDFSKFFDNVSHELVKRIVREEISDERLLQISDHFIDMFGDVGLGLGSQISQVLSLASANSLDHYIKEVLQIKMYGRYMDDGYLIHPSKEKLVECMHEIKRICDDLDIALNQKKTQIVKLSHGFTWLKIRFYLTDTGKVVKKIYKRSITKMRRKLKTLRRKYDNGEMQFEDVQATWQTWQAYALKFNAWHTVQNMRELYYQLFLKEMEGSRYALY